MARNALIGALGIFAVSVAGRIILQIFGGPDVGDVSWVTTFGVIAASWLGLGGQIAAVQATAQKVEKQTNGVLEKKIENAVDAAATKAVLAVTNGDDER